MRGMWARACSISLDESLSTFPRLPAYRRGARTSLRSDLAIAAGSPYQRGFNRDGGIASAC